MEIVETAASNLICHKEYEKACESHAINGEVLANTNYKDGMLYHEGRIQLPCDKALKQMAFETELDTRVDAQLGLDKTLEIIYPNLYWPMKAEVIQNYVHVNRGVMSTRCEATTNNRME